MAQATAKHIVIVGAGFGGLTLAKFLARRVRSPHRITVIDQRNHHLFQPLLYQVAMAGLSPAEIAAPIRSVLRGRENSQVLLGLVKDVDLVRREIETDFGKIGFDYLVLACGSSHSYFGHDEWRPFAPGLKSIEQATEIRAKVFRAFELAERESEDDKRQTYQTLVVVGGGPTGVELAGSLGEICSFTLAKEFRNFDPRKTRIVLLEAGPRILPSFAPNLSSRAESDLKDLGVEVKTHSQVIEVTASGVRTKEEFIPSATVLWAAGVSSSPLNARLSEKYPQKIVRDRQGRLIVNGDLSLPGFPFAFVIGDQAHFEDRKYGVLPGLAPAAMQQGRFVGRLLMDELNSPQRPRKIFRYQDKGQMATIGRRRAVAEVSGFHFAGVFAWLVWLVVHIYYLIGFRNRLFVLYDWAYSYLTYRKTARLIVGEHEKT